MKYGKAPIDLGIYALKCPEMLHYQCLPIKLIDSPYYVIPQNLLWIRPLLHAFPFPEDKYVYVTARNTYVCPGYTGSRPGWHSDGFLTEDINYIWSDVLPTEFAIQEFNIDENCEDSLRQFEEQAVTKVNYGNNKLLKLDPSVIHRPAINTNYEGLRTFVKISVSKDRYNLVGNSHNYELDYRWKMVERDKNRNHQSLT